MGGLARRAAYIKDQTQEPTHVLNLDCGDFLSGGREIDSIKAEYLVKAFEQLKLDAINVGERDFMLGPQLLLDIKKKYDLPLISANVYYPDSAKRFLAPYIVRKFKGFKTDGLAMNSVSVGVFGVVVKRPVLVYSKFTPSLITTDPFKETERVLKELKGKCDVIIALAHLPSNELKDFQDRFPEIDLIIGGHSFYNEIVTDSTGLAALVQTGSKGQYVGDIELKLNKKNQIEQINAINKAIDIDIPLDPDLKILEEESDKAIRDYYESKTKIQHVN